MHRSEHDKHKKTGSRKIFQTTVELKKNKTKKTQTTTEKYPQKNSIKIEEKMNNKRRTSLR